MSEERTEKPTEKALAVSGGQEVSEEILNLYKNRFIAAVDSAAAYLRKHHVIPDLFVGDCDSVDADSMEYISSHNVPVMLFDAKKDYTDTELCIKELLNRGFGDIVIICATGGRVDHTASNISILLMLSSPGAKSRIVDDKNEIYVLTCGVYKVNKRGKKYFSLISITRESEYTTEGFLYEVKNCRIRRDRAGEGISNEMKRESGTLEIQSGTVLIVQSSD